MADIWKGGGGGYKVMCFFGVQVDGLISERANKREEKEKTSKRKLAVSPNTCNFNHDF